MKDGRGITIKEGDKVIYSVALNRFGKHKLGAGKVVKINKAMVRVEPELPKGLKDYDEAPGEFNKNPDKVIVVVDFPT